MEILKESGNPFEQNLILKLVLEHVGSVSVPDLLTCRMVNHSWNRVAVQVLEEQHSYAVELDYKKLLELRALLWKTQMSRMSSEYKTELTSLKLSLNINPLDFSDGGLLSDGAEAGQLLISYPQLRVAFLTLSTNSYLIQPRPFGVLLITNHELYNLFKLASTSLTSIKISDVSVAADFEDFDFECYTSVEFPRLTSIHYDFDLYQFPENESTHLTKHLVSIIQRAPKLTKLHVDSWESDVEKSIGSYRCLLEICAAKSDLEELDIYEGHGEMVLKALPSVEFPKLRTFKLRKSFVHTPQDEGELAQFLEHNCPALTAIILKWTYYLKFNFSVEEDDEVPTIEFPMLPNILHFGLYPEYELRSPNYLQMIRATFAEELAKKFPSLQSMSINLGVLLMLGAHLKESGHEFPPSADPEEYPTFPNITSLEVSINIQYKEEDLTDLRLMASRMYRHTFPALTRLVIKLDKSLLWDSAKSFKQLDFLASRSSLRFLEIHNCPTKWINEIPRKVSRKLRGLKSLKIFVPKKGAGAGVSKNLSRPPPIEILKVLSPFPALEYLQIDNQVVSKAEIQTIRNVVSRFEKP